MQSRFAAKKRRILEQLDASEHEYHDLSPKGSVDEPIRTLIGDINSIEGIVTTSSCSGRISVFLEGQKDFEDAEALHAKNSARAGPGGKGGGGIWLFISHTPVHVPSRESDSQLMATFGLRTSSAENGSLSNPECRYIHLKFEPMILHILTASLDASHHVLSAALGAGFRESGAVSLSPSKTGEVNPMVAVRSTGYSFDAIVGYQDQKGDNIALVDEEYLRVLVNIANERFKINTDRITRFRSSLHDHCIQNSTQGDNSVPSLSFSSKTDWEASDVRRQRKREEGLARQRALRGQKSPPAPEDTEDASNNDIAMDIFEQ